MLINKDSEISKKTLKKLEKNFESYRTLQTLSINNAMKYCFLEYIISKKLAFGAGDFFPLSDELRLKIQMILKNFAKIEIQKEMFFQIPENEINSIHKGHLNGVFISLLGKK